ncbi:MAG: hypothetical protein M3N47_01675 [Chloroflexota bacterium]|nr:hypothetical protein [Chloroflexota bacterium]
MSAPVEHDSRGVVLEQQPDEQLTQRALLVDRGRCLRLQIAQRLTVSFPDV